MALYHGEQPYSGPLRLQDCIDAPKALIELAWQSSFLLIDLSRHSDEDLKKHAWAGVFQLTLKHIRNPDIMARLAPLWPAMAAIEKETGGLAFPELVFRCLFEASQVVNLKAVVEVAVKSLP